MMKASFLAAALLAVAGLLAGCSSVPQHCNLTGSWTYTFQENGRDDIQNGSMQLIQNGHKLSGKCNDAYGEFTVDGNINKERIVIDAVRNDNKRSCHMDAALKHENEFAGTYSTDQNTSGTIKIKRVDQ